MSDRCNGFRPGREDFPPRCNLPAEHDPGRHRSHIFVWIQNVRVIYVEEWTDVA